MSYLIHYNHNHDPKTGRFTGPGGPANDRTVLPKGTRLNSVKGYTVQEYAYSSRKPIKRANAYRKSGRALYTYNPDDKWDSSVYKGPFVRYNVLYRGKSYIDEYQYKTKKDLRMPTRQQRMDEFKNLYSDKKYGSTIRKEMAPIQSNLIKHKVGSAKEQKNWSKVDINNPKTDAEWEIAYKIFNHAMEASYMGKSTSEYMRRMSKNYDAMVDDNNQKYYNGVHDPIIIFKANKFLETIGANEMTVEEMRKNDDFVRKELAKNGHLPKL